MSRKQNSDTSVPRKPTTSVGISQRTESRAEKAHALRIALESLEEPITIASRRVGLGLKEATALYVQTAISERERAYRLGVQDGKFALARRAS